MSIMYMQNFNFLTSLVLQNFQPKCREMCSLFCCSTVVAFPCPFSQLGDKNWTTFHRAKKLDFRKILNTCFTIVKRH